MGGFTAYRVLCGVCAGLALLLGIAFSLQGFAGLAPGAPAGDPLPLGPGGVYMLAFVGALAIAWGGSLVGAARRPASGRTVGTASAVALVLMAAFRMWAWLMGDFYSSLGELPRFEAGLFLLLALAFVWLRPAGQEAPA